MAVAFLLAADSVGATDGTGAVLGKVLDPSGLFVPSARILISQESNPKIQYLANGNAFGLFYVSSVAPEMYTVTIAVQGFRTKVLAHVQVATDKRIDLGNIGLELADCNSPGVICDDFGLGIYNDTIHAQGVIEFPELCAVDIDEGHVFCTVELDGRGIIPPERDKNSDFWVKIEVNGAVYLKSRNGARFALNPPTESSKQGCISASYSSRDVRIDGLPIGSRVCIQTNRGRYAQVGFLGVVKQKAARLKAAFVTWAGPPDSPAVQNGQHQ